MDSAKLNDWIQVVGISATNAAVKDAFRELNLIIASSPELAKAVAANAENPGDAPPG